MLGTQDVASLYGDCGYWEIFLSCDMKYSHVSFNVEWNETVDILRGWMYVYVHVYYEK